MMNVFELEFNNFCEEMETLDQEIEVNEELTLQEYLDMELHSQWFNRLVEDGLIEIN